MLRHKDAAIETLNRFTNKMPKLTPQQARKVRRALGKPIPEDLEVSRDSVPDDVEHEMNKLRKDNTSLRETVEQLMDQVKSLLNRMTAPPVVAPEIPALPEAPAPSPEADANLNEASAKVQDVFTQPPRRGPRRAPATLPDAEK